MKKRVAVVAALLALALGYAGIMLANNHIAQNLERKLLEIPLPPRTQALDSLWVAGKMEGNGNGMQYFAELLVRSDLDKAALEAHYAALETEQDSVRVFRQTSSEVFEYAGVCFDGFEDSANCFRVQLARYSVAGFEETLWEGLLNCDLRGH